MISKLKFISSIFCWLLSFLIVLNLTNNQIVFDLTITFFVLVIFFSILKMKPQSYLIFFIIILISFFLLNSFPSKMEIIKALQFTLIFACVFPTLIFLRSIAMEMPSVKKTQNRLKKLDPENSSLGLQITSHFLGGVINVGSFPLIAATINKNENKKTRKIAAEASLRGMNSAVLWSPFFVSFAVASAYFPNGFEMYAILLGIFTSFFFNFISIFIFTNRKNKNLISYGFYPLVPIFTRLFIIMISVVIISIITGFTALHAVVATMPLLFVFQILRRKKLLKKILTNFYNLEKAAGDELVIICISMVIATLAAKSTLILPIVEFLLGNNSDIWKFVLFLPIFVWFISIFGIHPVISSAPILAILSPYVSVYDAIFLMQSHMIGWASGTMTSFSSMSIITVANQFNLKPLELAFGKNLFVSGCLSIIGGTVNSILYFLLKV